MKGKITISSPTCGNSDKCVQIQIKDQASRIRFVDVKISYETFARALMGLSEQSCDLTVRGIDHVGKNKITEPFSFQVDADIFKRKDLAIKRCEELDLMGCWIYSKYFDSQSSFTINERGETIAHTTRYRFEE